MNWKYVKPLISEKSIGSFEKLVNYKFPESFINCVKQYNGGKPEYSIFDTNKMLERELKCFLSFNKEDKESIWKIYEWNQEEIKDKYIPFAIDNVGNLICFDRSDNIIFINCETLNVEFIAPSFSAFVKSLYKNVVYYKDADTGNIIRYMRGRGIECLKTGKLDWQKCGANSNYYREIFLGEGNNCLIQISSSEALRIFFFNDPNG